MGVSVEEIHTQPFCLEWSKIIERIVASEVGLFDRSAVIGTSVWLPRNPSDPKNTILQHRFVTAKLTDLDMQILDGTWQQFLPEDARIPGLPRMLVGTIDDVTEQAGHAGVPDALLGVWQEAKPLPTSALYP